MFRRLIPVALICALGALLVWLWTWQPQPGPDAPAHRRLDLAGAPVGGDFALESWRGPVSLSDFAGQLVLIYFGYTSCPDICPTNLAILSYALKQLPPAERERVQLLFVSVDPERDTVARLKEFADYFDPTMLGLTASPDVVAEVAARYGAAYRRVDDPGSAMGYMVDHSSYTYVVDPAGKLVQTLAHATPAEQVIDVIRAELAKR